MNFTDVHRKFASRFLEALNTPTSLKTWLLIKHGEWDQLVSQRVDPALYLDAESFYKDYQAAELFRKCAGLPTTFDTKQAAIQGFHTAEMQCFRTNRYLNRFSKHGLLDPEDLPTSEFLRAIGKRISRWLGSTPTHLDGRFGPGATFSTTSRNSTICDKMQFPPTITPAAWIFGSSWTQTLWYRSLDEQRVGPDCIELECVRGNRFTTVPKDARTDRGIAVEPSINGFYQLAIGQFLRKRLARIGIDLEEGQATHARMARDASSKGDFCTIDLSSASDTISKVLVEILLPEQWYQLLNSLRCEFTRVEGEWHYLEKFSSMGNGFTFELETLIFLAICCTAIEFSGGEPVPGYNVFTYGDDIICPTEFASSVTKALQMLGFTINTRKTFTSGPFRESCGGDYFLGTDVVPFRIKELPSRPEEWIVLANQLYDTSIRRYGIMVWKPVHSFILDQLPANIRRCRGPAVLGDLVIHTDDISQWDWKNRGDGLMKLSVYAPVSRLLPFRRWNPSTQFAAALYGLSSDGVPFRNNVSGYRVRRVVYPIGFPHERYPRPEWFRKLFPSLEGA